MKVKQLDAQSFTLVEILVVMAILSVIVVGLVIAINPFRQIAKAQDITRKTALTSIKKSLDSYYLTYGHYPQTSGWVNSTHGSMWIPGLVESGSAKKIPVDPTNNQTGGTPSSSVNNFAYYYRSDDWYDGVGGPDCDANSSNSYILTARLADSSDSQNGNVITIGNGTEGCELIVPGAITLDQKTDLQIIRGPTGTSGITPTLPPLPTSPPTMLTIPPASPLWAGNAEEGNTRDWWYPELAGHEGNNCGGEYNSDGGVTGIESTIKHSGNYSVFLKNNAMESGQQGSRLFRWCEAMQNNQLYYSTWYYIPIRVTINYWWMIMEWKSQGSYNHKFGIQMYNRPDGSMFLYLSRGNDSGGGNWSQNIKNVPVAQWFHLEVFYKKAVDNTGRITVYQDGTQIIDATNITTANSSDLRWAIINYGDATVPGDLTIYADDAAISTTRTGN